MREFWKQDLVMPTFAEPLYLFGLVFPLLLLIWIWSRRFLFPHRRVVLPLDQAKAKSGWRLWATIVEAESIPAFLLALGIILLAGPQINGAPKDKRNLTNIQICVDVSGSMLATYGEGNRYDAAMIAVDKFVDYRKGDAFGLTFFGDAFVHWVPLTSDPAAIKCATPFMSPDIAPDAFGGTSIAKVMRGCRKELVERDQGEDRMLLIVTDGISYDLQDAAEELSKQFQQDKIVVFAVIAAEFDPQPELLTICQNTGGEAFRADDPKALEQVFKKIDTMKKAKFTPTFVERVDYFKPFCLMALVLIAQAAIWGLGLRFTPW
ncbi:MAG: vWA domain-containing protein [Fimbriiglobus sp.]